MSDRELRESLRQSYNQSVADGIAKTAIANYARTQELDYVNTTEHYVANNAKALINVLKRQAQRQYGRRNIGAVVLRRPKPHYLSFVQTDESMRYQECIASGLFGESEEPSPEGTVRYGWRLLMPRAHTGYPHEEPYEFMADRFYRRQIIIARTATQNGQAASEYWYSIGPDKEPGKVIKSYPPAHDTELEVITREIDRMVEAFNSCDQEAEDKLEAMYRNEDLINAFHSKFSNPMPMCAEFRTLLQLEAPTAGQGAIEHCHQLTSLALQEFSTI